MGNIESQHTTISHFSKLVLIESIGDGELHTGRWLHDDLLHICPKPISYYTVKNRRQFFAVLRRVRDDCAFQGTRPIIHVHAHGSKDAGLRLGAKDFVSWAEFAERVRPINVQCDGGLGVVLAACHGVFSFEEVDLLLPSPYAFLVAPPKEVTAGTIEKCMPVFYRKLFQTLNLGEAEAELAQHFLVIRAETFFYYIFEQVFHAQCMGKGAKQRIEELTTKAIRMGAARADRTLGTFRKALKLNNSYPETTYLRIGSKFLHGKALAPFDGFVERMRARYTSTA